MAMEKRQFVDVNGGCGLNFPCRLAITDGPLLAAIADESIAKLPMLNAQETTLVG